MQNPVHALHAVDQSIQKRRWSKDNQILRERRQLQHVDHAVVEAHGKVRMTAPEVEASLAGFAWAFGLIELDASFDTPVEELGISFPAQVMVFVGDGRLAEKLDELPM